jgi:hypothetical protein
MLGEAGSRRIGLTVDVIIALLDAIEAVLGLGDFSRGGPILDLFGHLAAEDISSHSRSGSHSRLCWLAVDDVVESMDRAVVLKERIDKE